MHVLGFSSETRCLPETRINFVVYTIHVIKVWLHICIDHPVYIVLAKIKVLLRCAHYV